MKKISCEQCGSTEFYIKDDIYICKYCQTHYLVKGTKKIRIEGHIDISGSSVEIDTSKRLINLYTIAHRAKRNKNKELASEYYQKILEIDPSSWEANFYISYYRALKCSRKSEINLVAKRIIISQETTIELIFNNVLDADERRQAVNEVAEQWNRLAKIFFNAYHNYFQELEEEQKSKNLQNYIDTCSSARDIAYLAGDWIIIYFGDKYGSIAADCWKAGIELHRQMNNGLIDWDSDARIIEERKKEILKFDPLYEKKGDNHESYKNEGCYIATAVYGSYDCPQVWTLRRFRDHTLAKTWYGRSFIRIYYAVSPYLVRWFGHTKWFQGFWRSRLDSLIAKLNNNGVSDTPYDDRNVK